MNTGSIAKHHIITYWSKDVNAFIAEMPDLPKCMSNGPTEEEARRNIQRIAQKWISRAKYLGREIPTPRSLTAALVVHPVNQVY